MQTDLDFVLTGGLWVIVNQYLVVQKWRPNFVPEKEPIKRMSISVRLSKLPMEWIDMDLLRNIGSILGSINKVDPITKTQSRGWFAIICIDIDLSEPLKNSLRVDGRSIKVEYESLGICVGCGKVGYVKENCSVGLVNHESTDKAVGIYALKLVNVNG
ncbi:hypothetical protein ACOSQ3_033051 [Xanthoceras sorbifolium]